MNASLAVTALTLIGGLCVIAYEPPERSQPQTEPSSKAVADRKAAPPPADEHELANALSTGNLNDGVPPLEHGLEAIGNAIVAHYREYPLVTAKRGLFHYFQSNVSTSDTYLISPFSPEPFLSDADSASPHGRKPYRLWIRDKAGYSKVPDRSRAQAGDSSPDVEARPVVQSHATAGAWGQVVVMEQYELVPIAGGEIEATAPLTGPTLGPVRYNGGRTVGLFVMFKLDPKTPGTDQGWVYGVTNSSATEFLTFGKLESCMECHTRSKHDRMFAVNQRAWILPAPVPAAPR